MLFFCFDNLDIIELSLDIYDKWWLSRYIALFAYCPC